MAVIPRVADGPAAEVEPEVAEQALRLKESALLDFGIGRSVVASWLYAKCHKHIATTAIPTAAVGATGDGICVLLYNPYFFASLDLDGVSFVLFHEARHLVHRHLHVDEVLRRDPLFTVAAEVSINHVAKVRLHRTDLPRQLVRADDGTQSRSTVGIDPDEIYRSYVADLSARAEPVLPYDEFIRTDLRIYDELKRMKNPPVLGEFVCAHVELWDQEAVDALGHGVLTETMRAALRGNAKAREELLDLAARTGEDSARQQRIWGELGLAKLRGETPKVRRIDWWKQWLVDVLASKLTEGERLIYPKKHGAVLLALGHEPFLQRRGPERTKVVLVAFDTSGSMPDHVVAWLTTLVGQTDGVQSHWLSFDGAVQPFKPGERVVGGGGTNFQHVVDYAEGRLEVDGKRFTEDVDAVVMVTDGYAPRVTPAQPDKWIWLITDGGDEWPERHDPPMACHRVTAQA